MAHTFDKYNDILTPKDIMEILGVGANKVYELLSSGTIKNFQIGRSRRIPKECLIEYVRISTEPNIHSNVQGDESNDSNTED